MKTKTLAKKPVEQYSGEQLVELFSRCGGDVVSFSMHFENSDISPQYILSRVLCVLNAKGNEVFLEQFLKMEFFASQARLMYQRAIAFENLSKMPTPDSLENSKMSKANEWKAYGEFWTKLPSSYALMQSAKGDGVGTPLVPSLNGGEMAAVAEMREAMKAHAEEYSDEDAA